MTEPVDHKKAAQDAEWLAGSEADTGERNLARAYLALREQVATLTSELAHQRQVAEDAEVRLMSMNARLAINPSECVQILREELEDAIRDEMSGGPPGRDVRWPDAIDALVSAVRAERDAEIRAMVEGMPTHVADDDRSLFVWYADLLALLSEREAT